MVMCRGKDSAVARLDEFTNDLIARLELPRLNFAIVWLIQYPVNVGPNLSSPNGAPYVDAFIDQLDEYLG
jgi:hypothetical protein